MVGHQGKLLHLIPELLEKKITELNPVLQPFTTPADDLPPESTFYVNQEGATCVHDPKDLQQQPSMEQQQAASERFFSALEDFFGTALIEKRLSEGSILNFLISSRKLPTLGPPPTIATLPLWGNNSGK